MSRLQPAPPVPERPPTLHPSAVLRMDDEHERREAMGLIVGDLRRVAARLDDA